jgi:hypothetical protein
MNKEEMIISIFRCSTAAYYTILYREELALVPQSSD